MCYRRDIIGKPPRTTCSPASTRTCGLFNEIARLIALIIIPCAFIFISCYKTIRNINQSRINVTTVGSLQHGIRRTDRQLIRVKINFSNCFIDHNIDAIYGARHLYGFHTGGSKMSITMKSRNTLGSEKSYGCRYGYSAFSFFAYVTFGESLFRQTFNQLLQNIIHNMNISTK